MPSVALTPSNSLSPFTASSPTFSSYKPAQTRNISKPFHYGQLRCNGRGGSDQGMEFCGNEGMTMKIRVPEKNIAALLTHNRRQPALRLCPDLLYLLFHLITASSSSSSSSAYSLGLEDEENTFSSGYSHFTSKTQSRSTGSKRGLQDRYFSPRQTLLALSQICHDWRSAALSFPSLWVSQVDFESPFSFSSGTHTLCWDWNEEMMKRSAPLPVNIGSSTFPPRDSRSVHREIGAGRLSRVRKYRLGFVSGGSGGGGSRALGFGLDFGGSTPSSPEIGGWTRQKNEDTWTALLDALSQPAPHLEYLSLAHVSLGSAYDHHPNRDVQLQQQRFRSSFPSSAIDSMSLQEQMGRFVLPPTLFGDAFSDEDSDAGLSELGTGAPKLRTLKLSGLNVHPSAPFLAQLTSLSVLDVISDSNSHQGTTRSVEGWLEMLSGMRALEVLVLRGAVARRGGTFRSDKEGALGCVHLPNLKLLHLEERLEEVAALLGVLPQSSPSGSSRLYSSTSSNGSPSRGIRFPPGCELTFVCKECVVRPSSPPLPSGRSALEMLEGIQRVWASGLVGALGVHRGQEKRARDAKASGKGKGKEGDEEEEAGIAMSIFACGSSLSVAVDDRVKKGAEAALPRMTSSSSTPSPSSKSTSTPSFYLDMHAPHGSYWDPMLPGLLSVLSEEAKLNDQFGSFVSWLQPSSPDSSPSSSSTSSLSYTDCSNQLSSLISTVLENIDEPPTSYLTSLELILPAPHLDLLPFLRKARRVRALVGLPGWFAGWIVNELSASAGRVLGDNGDDDEANDVDSRNRIRNQPPPSFRDEEQEGDAEKDDEIEVWVRVETVSDTFSRASSSRPSSSSGRSEHEAAAVEVALEEGVNDGTEPHEDDVLMRLGGGAGRISGRGSNSVPGSNEADDQARPRSAEAQPERRRGVVASGEMVLLPMLEAMSFGDDRCLYGPNWTALEKLVRARRHLSYPSSNRFSPSPTTPTSSLTLSSSSSTDQPLASRISKLGWKKCYVSEERMWALQSLGVDVDCDIVSFTRM